MKKLLLLTNNCGGLYLFRRELLSKLSQLFSVIVCSPVDEHTENIESLGCLVVASPLDRRGINPIKDLKLLWGYVRLLHKERPDIALLYTVKPNVYGGLACRMTKTPYLPNVTGLGTSVENGGALQKIVLTLYQIGLRKSRCTFFQNSENQQFFINRQVVLGPTRLIPGSGVNLQGHTFEPYPEKDKPIRFTFVGRIMRDKGIYELLQAAAAIKEKYPEVIFDLIGGFDESCQDGVRQAERKGDINYLGPQSDVHPFYQRSWAVIMPSYHEGMSNVCLEAAATGRPVLASDVPGCRETFDEGVSGLGFAAKDAECLTSAIEKFIALPYDQKVKMGRSGREKMEREFDRQIIVDAYLEEINKALQE